MVEAAGVGLITMLTARNLLILGSATRAKKAPLPDPLYVYCTKMLFARESNRHRMATTVSHRSSGMDRQKSPRLRVNAIISHKPHIGSGADPQSGNLGGRRLKYRLTLREAEA